MRLKETFIKYIFMLGVIFSISFLFDLNIYAQDNSILEVYDTPIDESAIQVYFDANYGENLQCAPLTTVLDTATPLCLGHYQAGETANFPEASSNMFRSDQGKLLGWSLSPNCIQGEINQDNSFTVNSEVTYYACYKEVINGKRYVQKNAVIDGDEIPCGTEVHVDYCINTDGGQSCFVEYNGRKTVDRMKLANKLEGAIATCTEQQDTPDLGYRFAGTSDENYSCGEELYITTCTEDICNYTKVKNGNTITEVSGTIDRNLLAKSSSGALNMCKENKCSNSKLTNRRKESNFTLCYEKNKSDIEILKGDLEKQYVCDIENGYYFDKTAVYALNEKNCNDKNLCLQTFHVSCTRGVAAKPTLSVSSGITGNNNIGTINVKAQATEGKIVSYYYSEKHLTPDDSFDWISTSRNTFTIDTTPGTIYIWVRDSKGNISNAVSGTVFDTVTTDTTVKNLSLYDKNGKLQTPTSSKVSYLMKSSNYVKLSNDLVSDSDVLADAFNPFDMEYKLEVDSPTISVYATLTSNDSSYVSGYEPRTVNLDYGLNTILIKIKNKEGKVRTYTILVTRTDDRTSDNTLKDININVGNINFDPNVTDYKIEIPESVKTVNVKALISNNKANYISGYEDGSVKIDGDSTVKLIKVKSETGSTRTYILTFIKKGTDSIINKSLQLNDLVIPGINIPFEESVSNYSLSVDYEINKIDVKPMLKDSNSRFNIKIKRKNETNYQDVSRNGISLDVGENFLEVEVTSISGKKSYYRLTIIRKEYGLEVSNDVKLKDLKVLGYDIKFEPNKKDYTVKIKQEKSLVITAIPNNSRAEVFIRGNNELTGFSTVRINVVAENGEDEIYSIDIKKDVFNQVIEVVSLLVGSIIIIVCSSIIIIKKNRESSREYYEE